jgi:biopolymer transport protein ExbB/TolQ
MSMNTVVGQLSELLLSSAPLGSGSMKDSIITFFKEGGPFMFVNVACLAFAIGVIVERIVTLMFRYNLNAVPFMEQITKLILTGNVDRAVKLCGAAPNAPLAKVIRAGLTRANRGELEVAKAVEESILEHTPAVQTRIGWLWSVANIATLVGLIGTITGLIRTFQSLGNIPADQKQAVLSSGISEAMNNTAFGLSIAVTCIIFHLILTSYSRRMVDVVELNALKLENLLARRVAGETSAMDFEKSA